MVKLEPTVNEAKLRELQAEQHESDQLEFIGACDLRQRRDVVELAAEAGAMAAKGGFIVVGVDDRGTPTGMVSDVHADLFDDASLRDKLSRYLPADVEVRAGRHPNGEAWLVVIYVAPHLDGAVVFQADGIFEHSGKAKTVFRRGEFFVRHGSKRERPHQADIRRLRQEAIEGSRLWVDQLQRVSDIINELGQLVEEESRGTGERLAGHPTRIPALRARLGTALALLDDVGGPDLPVCQNLASATHYVFYDQLRSDVYLAMTEIAHAAESGLRRTRQEREGPIA